MSDHGGSWGIGGTGFLPPHQRPPGRAPDLAVSGECAPLRAADGSRPPRGLIKLGGSATLPLGVVGVWRGAPACNRLKFVQGEGTKFKGLRL